MTPLPLQVGHAPRLELKSAGFTPFDLANALRSGRCRPVYVAGLLRREPRIALVVVTTRRARRPSRGSVSLAGTGHACDGTEHPERDVDVDVPQVVRRRAADTSVPERTHRSLGSPGHRDGGR